MRGRHRELVVLVALVAGLAIVAAVSLQGGGSGSTTAPSARPAATAFAQSYVQFLAGRTNAAGIQYATPAVRSLAASSGLVPPAYRGRLTLRGLTFSGVLGAPHATALLTADAGANTLRSAFSLIYLDSRWHVSALVPPDFPTVFSPPAPALHTPPAASAAARAFALSYANYRTGAGPLPQQVLSYIRQQIAAGRDPLAGTARTRRPARLLQLAALPNGTVTAVDAVTAAGSHKLSFSFLMQLAGGRWQAWQFPETSP